MDVARGLDPADVELTFLEHVEEECDFDAEIRRLGHRVARVPVTALTRHLRPEAARHPAP